MFSTMDPRAGDRMGVSGEAETAKVPLVTKGGFSSQHPPPEDPLRILRRHLHMLLLLQTLTLRISFQDPAG